MEKRKHQILFVDDDPFVLKGFRRSVADFEEAWQVDFALSGQEALNKLAQQAFDAVVTDMQMPGMDGLQLLETVSQNNPGVMRFVLSGNASEAKTLQSTYLVHQMIAKPCDMEQVYTIVERACRLRDMLSDPKLLNIITGIKSLPSVPLIYNQLLKALQSEDVSPQIVANIISQDAAMTAKILQLVNSAFFGLADNISQPQRAVTLLGLNTVKALVLGIKVFSEFQTTTPSPISIDALWKHSMVVSNLAFNISRSLKLSLLEQENARVAGVLHDVGRLLLFKIPGFFSQARFDKNGLITVESEYQILDTSHAEMGGYLLGLWGLPYPIVEAITFHHRPGPYTPEKPNLVSVLYIANALADMCQFEKEPVYAAYLDLNYVEKKGLSPHLDEWTAMTCELLNKVN
jgi:HD-like signal output (HDOD) protein